MPNQPAQLEFAISELARRMRRVYNRRFQEAGVSAQQGAALIFLDRYGPQSQNELGERMELSKAAVGALLGRMEAAGLVIRDRDENDARARVVTVAPKAQEALARIEALTAELGTRLRTGLDTQQRRLVADALNLMSSNLRGVEEAESKSAD